LEPLAKALQKSTKKNTCARVCVWSSAEEMQNVLRHIREIIEQEYARYTFNSSP
jgi:hypothetical protein